MKFLYFLLILLCSNSYSQTTILDKYPPTQHFYQKGELNFIKSLQKAAKDYGVKPCDNKSDFYKLTLIVYPDKTVKFVKDSDSIGVGKSKCAYEFAKETFKYLKDWNPVIIEGKAYAALVNYDIYPADVLSYKITDDLSFDIKNAEYPGGHKRFVKDVERIIQTTMSKYRINLNYETVHLSFTISKEGYMKNIKFSQNIPFRTIEDLLLDFKKLSKWKPGTRNGVSIESNFNMPMTFQY
ncbi:energy transducer TonB [Epilithonimonas lactis]|uniref:TonB C-terminal domain-containing protein n=1 Tax=Epilithonimonas lactis TaxID=421072 RepID=A0A085BML0_9FLAO|nr:hypothetical protein [Epilithonimonas lactis]KFC23705.1 hypothetical protein IO89_03825 [Epilithonimonas lactis]SEQ22457.1 hypothetical protein SAMN04488097_1732 [Epilithonimonas lactis]